MNHTTLEIFKTVAEERSVTRAAKLLGRAQSNITTRIHQLEEELGVELFARGNKRMLLSPAGEHFLGYALRILSLAEEARQALHPATPGGNLRMGAMDATAASRLPQLLPRFHAQCPEVKLTLKTQPTRQLAQQVLDAELDCALVSLPQGAPPPDDLEFVPIFQEQLMLVLQAHPQPFRFAAFAEGCTYRAMGEAFLAQSEEAEIEVQDVGSYHAMLACVASGGYAGIVPQSVLETLTLPEASQLQPVGQAITQLIWRKGYASPALEKMRQLLESASDL
ncbi:LysR substrate-binding domain-containing protein [Klebsiella oxytoca]|uniref:LysR family transcriptional regulator n=1 Tax=Klebsiella oxytoca TaxID=571 RepID=UPI002FF98C46